MIFWVCHTRAWSVQGSLTSPHIWHSTCMFLSILHHCSLQCFCYSSFLEVWRGELFLGGAHLPKFTQGVCTRSSGFGSIQIRSSEAGVSAASACCMRICVWRMPRSIRTASGVHIGWKQACAVHLRVSPVQPVGCWLMSGSMRYQHYLGVFLYPLSTIMAGLLLLLFILSHVCHYQPCCAGCL